MSSKVNTTAIGGFIVGAVLLVLGAIVFIGGEDLFGKAGDKVYAVVIFTGSVKGLDVGAPVTMRGVKIGEVKSIDVSFDARSLEFVIPVVMRLDRRELEVGMEGDDYIQQLIARGMRAQLKTQSLLTGLLYIDLDFLPETKPRYVEFATTEPQIPTTPTELEAILQRVSQIDVQAFVQQADQAIRHINALLGDPEAGKVAVNLNETLAATTLLAQNVDREVLELSKRIDALAGSADGAMGDIRGEVRALNVRLDSTLKNVDTTLKTLSGAADSLGYTASDQSPVLFELTKAAGELARAGRALQALADNLERQPESLIRGKQEQKQ